MTSPRFPPRYYRTIPSNEEFSGFKQIPRRMILIWGATGLTVEVKKILESENQAGARRGLSLRSVLLLVLLVGVGAGATAYAISTAFAAGAASSTTTQQSTSTTSATSSAHNCTLASLALTTA